MTKAHYILIILGLGLFIWDVSYGIGWLLGWLFVVILKKYREPVLEHIIDFDHFSVRTYVVYLLGVMVWVAIPLLISVLLPEYINPYAVFGAFFTDRLLMFLSNSFRKGGK